MHTLRDTHLTVSVGINKKETNKMRNRRSFYSSSFLAFMLLLFSSNLEGQNNELKPLLQTDWALNNLKGKVKSVKVKIERHYDTEELSDAKQAEYDFYNYFVLKGLPLGYWKFDKLGFLKYKNVRFKDKGWDHLAVQVRNNQRYKYSSDRADYAIKKDWKGPYTFDYPVYNPYAVYLNYSSLFLSTNKKSREAQNRIYTYRFNSDSLINTELFITHIVDSIINHRKQYRINSEGLITSQSYIFSEGFEEKWDLIKTVAITGRNSEGMDVRAVDNIESKFEYDDLKRLTKATIYRNESVKWEEKYFYKNSLEWPYQVDRFYNVSPENKRYFSKYKRTWYNEFGDPIKSENYKSIDMTRVRTRFYEYIYDDQNNWIQCDMYLEGEVEKTEEPTITHYRKIKYY